MVDEHPSLARSGYLIDAGSRRRSALPGTLVSMTSFSCPLCPLLEATSCSTSRGRVAYVVVYLPDPHSSPQFPVKCGLSTVRTAGNNGIGTSWTQAKRDVAILEEPEHLSWFNRRFRWSLEFNHVIGALLASLPARHIM